MDALASKLVALSLAAMDPARTPAERDALAATLPDVDRPAPRSRYRVGETEVNVRGTHPLRGDASPLRLDAIDDGDDLVVSFDARHEGAPGRVHGAFVAGLFDVVLGRVAIGVHPRGLTSELEVRFLAATPLHEPVRYSGDVTGREGRRTFVAGTAALADGTVVAVARLVSVEPRAG